MNDLYLESQDGKLAPERDLWNQLYYLNGYGAICKLIFSVANFDVYFKKLFINYCESISDECFIYIHFIVDCIQLQQTENEEVIPLFIYIIIYFILLLLIIYFIFQLDYKIFNK